MYPAAAQLAPGLAPRYAEALGEVLNNSSLWTNSGNDPKGVHD